jgi:hypothetical protein
MNARRGPPDALASVVLGCLVLACLGAFFLTQRLKHTPTAVQTFELTPVFSPYPGSRLKQEAISFKLKQADSVTVTVIDSEGDVVATLVRERPLPRYKQFSLRWNGRRGIARVHQLTRTSSGRLVVVALPTGPLAKPGDYRVEIHLHDQRRTIRSPRSFALVAP